MPPMWINQDGQRAPTGPTGPLALTLPRATLFTAISAPCWQSRS